MRTSCKVFLLGTAFAVAVPTASFADPVTFSVTLSGSSSKEGNRLFRDSNPSTFTSKKAFPGIFTGGPFAYQTFAFSPDGAAFETVSVVAPDYQTFFSVYLNSFDPTNLATNYLGDGGSSGTTTFSFIVPQRDDFILVANNVSSGSYGGAATVTVTGHNAVGVTPEPGSLVLMTTGIAGLALFGMRRRKGLSV